MNIELSFLDHAWPALEVIHDLHWLAREISPEAKVTPQTVSALVCSNVKLLIARDTHARRIVGMGSLILQHRITGLITRIEHVSVNKEYRRLGIGTAIVQTLLQESQRVKALRVDLGTSNPEAEALYRKLGFKLNDREKVYRYTPS